MNKDQHTSTLKGDLLNFEYSFEMIINSRRNKHNTQLHDRARIERERAWQLQNIIGKILVKKD
jgi:hypothetical protein